MTRTAVVMVMILAAGTGLAHAGQAASAAPRKEAAEQKVSLKSLPPAVRSTVEAETKNATIKGITRETAKGQTVYEVESIVDGRTRDLMVDAAGKVYVVEEQLDAAKAPEPVRSALEAKGTIVVLESVAENGVTTYEGRVKTKAGKMLTMELDAAGKPVKK